VACQDPVIGVQWFDCRKLLNEKEQPMSTLPPDQPDNSDADDNSRSGAMNDQLRSDVASWRAARSESTAREPADFNVVPPVSATAPRPTVRAKRAKLASATAQSEPDKKKPFGMSYDGMSQADYISYMISRGAR
jgi:hypothetical protein